MGLLRRLRWAWRSRRRRGLLVRRAVAALLAVAAVVLAVRPVGDPVGVEAVVARVDVAPGTAFGPGELERRRIDEAALPTGALLDPALALGRRPVGPVRAGEILTDVRLVGREAAIAAAGTPDAAGVPLRLADAAVAALLRPGSRIDVVGSAGSGPDTGPVDTGAGTTVTGTTGTAVVLARDALVLDVLPAAERAGTGPVVVVALPGPDAARVAAATLGQEVTVTLR